MPIKQGEVINPKGSGSPGAKLSRKMINRYRADFAKHGIATIEAARKKNPVEYLKLGVSLLPKQFQVDVRHDFSQVLMEASKILEQQRQQAAGELEQLPSNTLPFPEKKQGDIIDAEILVDSDDSHSGTD